MKRIAIFLVCVLLAVGIIPRPVLADTGSGMVLVSETVTYVDETTYYIECIYVPEVCPSSDVRTGSKTAHFVYKGSSIFTVSVTGQFTYDGRAAKAISASGGVNVHVAGASLNSKNAYTSGASAIASASVSYLGTTLNKTVTLTCDANGNLS